MYIYFNNHNVYNHLFLLLAYTEVENSASKVLLVVLGTELLLIKMLMVLNLILNVKGDLRVTTTVVAFLLMIELRPVLYCFKI